MANYTHTTRGDFKAALLARLGDAAATYWLNTAAQPELNLLIAATLHKWSLLTGFWRDRRILHTRPGVAFYDLYNEAELADLLGYAVTDRDEVGLMQYMLCEPYEPLAGVGMSEQFTFAQLVAALQRGLNRVLDDTMSGVTKLMINADPAMGNPTLPDTTLSIRRAMWLSSDNYYSNLHRDDEIAATAYNTLWSLQPGIPELFSILADPPLTLSLVPPPLASGQIELIVADTGPALSPASPVVMQLHDDLCWVARAHALADLLSHDGPGQDAFRSQLMRSEYELGAALGNRMNSLAYCEINGRPVVPSSAAELDYAYSHPHWQNLTGSPTDLAMVDGNMLVVYPVPDGVYAISLDVIRKAIVPTADSDFIQVGREDIDALLDGSQSLALFKQGGAALVEASRLANQMIEAAAKYNSKLSVYGSYYNLTAAAVTEEAIRPERTDGRGLGTVAGSELSASRESIRDSKDSR